MRILIEEHQYPAEAVENIILGLTNLRNIKGKVSVNHVGYYYNPALNDGKGYDNCWVIDGYEDGDLHLAAVLCDKESGRMVEVSTDQPAVQVYTGNWLGGCPVSKSGKQYQDYDGVAIECQGMPDAPNHDNFPSQLLRPDEEYRRIILFDFKTVD